MISSMTTLASAKGQNIVALLRVDYNVKKPGETARISRSFPSIKLLLARGYSVVLLSHRGRPEKRDLRLSLRPIIPILEKNLKQSVTFFDPKNISQLKAIAGKKKSTISLIENLRFFRGEQKNSPHFAAALAKLGHLYINDAFADSHRKDASIVGIPKLLPSFIGLEFEREVNELHTAIGRRSIPLVLIIGGAKVPEKFDIIERLHKESGAILVGGIPANTILKAIGANIGASRYDKKELVRAKKIARYKNLILPCDFVWDNNIIKDTGHRTAECFRDYIARAKTIIWNGPMGEFENKQFMSGSKIVALLVAGSSAHSIVGGGDTATLIETLGLTRTISFLSIGGGAMLEYLAHGTLPGLEAINKSKK